jgi:hypothetical protein
VRRILELKEEQRETLTTKRRAHCGLREQSVLSHMRILSLFLAPSRGKILSSLARKEIRGRRKKRECGRER